MKIIFLDIDGVLCTIRAHIAQRQRGWMQALDREAVGLLNRLHEAKSDVPVRYVLSSTWRLFRDREWMEQYLKSYGWTGEFHDHWSTTQDPNGHRGTEVAIWLKHHPEVTSWVAIDDDRDFHENQMAHLANTDGYDGLRWLDFRRANLILHGNAEQWID